MLGAHRGDCILCVYRAGGKEEGAGDVHAVIASARK